MLSYLLVVALLAVALPLSSCEPCRDRFLWPFSSTSIWNRPIGTGAEFAAVGLYRTAPVHFHNDQDFVVEARETDPLTPWYNQGDWSGDDHCKVTQSSPAGALRFPHNFTSASDDGRSPPGLLNNNAAGVLMPDRRTLVQMQPLYRCAAGSPLLARWGNDTDGCPQNFPNVTDILGDGTYGAHGGSGLSSIGGTVRVGELFNASAPPIRHALKIELWSHKYYYGLKALQPPSVYNGNRTQYVWPATGSDSCSRGVPHGCYQGTNPHVAPGALLAIPSSLAHTLQPGTVPGQRLKDALTHYGGYIVDDTAGTTDKGALCMDAAVNSEMRAHLGYSMALPHGVSPSSGAPLFADLLLLFRALHVVTNNGPVAPSGGGTPLAPLAPPICDHEK